MSCNWNAVVGQRFVAFFDYVWLYARVHRTRYFVSFASNKTVVETHCVRCGNDFSAVVGVITDAYKIYHDLSKIAGVNEKLTC